MKITITMIAVLFSIISFSEVPLHGALLEEVKIIMISAQDGRAVIKTSERPLQIIKVGDAIGERATVIEISKGKVVIEEITEKGKETLIIRVENEKQTIERIRKIGNEQPNLYMPN